MKPSLIETFVEMQKADLEAMQRVMAPSLDLEAIARGPILSISAEQIEELARTHRTLTQQDREDIIAMLRGRASTPVRASYPLPKGASWAKLRIKFFDGHTVKVKYQGMPMATFDYKQLGFEDKKSHNPDGKWKFLRTMAEDGAITNSKFNKSFNRTTKYETARRLMRFFGMSENPFHEYTKADGYRPKFVLLPESAAASSDTD